MKELFDDILLKEHKFLTNKKPHTNYKIQYVSKYVEKWCYIVSETNKKTINFIDCMCNAGIYSDGDFCSATYVLKHFIVAALKHPNKQYNIFLNDYNPDKIRIIREVFYRVNVEKPNNLRVYFDSKDVNEYLLELKEKKNFFDFDSMTVLYVDPYSFHTVIIKNIEVFIKEVYCELLFNLFTSDFKRNKNDKGIIKILGGDYGIDSVSDLINHIKKRFSSKHIKYFWTYSFHHSKNAELYQIVFATPHLKGLDALKNSLWDLFGGEQFYRTDINKENGQMSLFTKNECKAINANYFSIEAQEAVMNRLGKSTVDYKDIEEIIIKETALPSSFTLKQVLMPLIDSKRIIKQNIKGKRNYKEDKYIIL